MSDLEGFAVFIGAVLTAAWGVALLVGVWKIRAALVDEEYPVEEMNEGGVSYRVQVSRVRGRFGVTYQKRDAEPVVVPPRFKDRGAALVHARMAIAGS